MTTQSKTAEYVRTRILKDNVWGPERCKLQAEDVLDVAPDVADIMIGTGVAKITKDDPTVKIENGNRVELEDAQE